MHGPELGVQADDIDAPEMDKEPKQEVLENKDVRFILCQIVNGRTLITTVTLQYLSLHYNYTLLANS